MRRIARLLADLLASYGYEVMVDAQLTGRSRNTYTVPLAARRDGQLVLADGDPTARSIDEGEVHRLVMAATDLGCRTALYVHAGELSVAACDAAQDRVHFWSRETIVPILGHAQWAHALGQPMPPLPGPLGNALPSAALSANAEPTPVVPLSSLVPVITDAPVTTATPAELATALPEPAPVFRPAPDEPRPAITLAEPDTLRDEQFLDLGGADLGDHPDEPVGGDLPEPAPELEVADIIPLPAAAPAPVPLLADVEPFEATLPDPEPTPSMAGIVEAAREFEAPAVSDLLPAGFQEPPAVAAPAPAIIAPPMAPSRLPEVPLETPAFRGAEPTGPAIVAPDGSRGLLPPRLPLKQAKALVADRLFDIEEAELILQPVHLFDYAVDLLREGSLNVQTITGRLQVNGTDRRVMATEPAASDPSLPHRVFATPDLTLMDKVCRVSPERAKQLAGEWATAQHAKVVNVNNANADDSFDLVEKKTIGPTSGQVQLTYLGLWHRPFWRLWGNNGHVDLDAVEGMVLDAEIKGPSADVMLVE